MTITLDTISILRELASVSTYPSKLLRDFCRLCKWTTSLPNHSNREYEFPVVLESSQSNDNNVYHEVGETALTSLTITYKVS